MSAVHKPRKKTKRGDGLESPVTGSDSAVVLDRTFQKPAFPLASFLWSARKGTSQWILLPLTLMVAGLFRWATGLWGYSGRMSSYRKPEYLLSYCRVPNTSHVWRLRGSTALDGDHKVFTCSKMVFLRSRILGSRLSSLDGLP